MPGDPCKHEGRSVLLVEGVNDCHVVLALCGTHKVPETFGLYQCGGKGRVLKRLNALIVAPDQPYAIGAVLDADADLEDEWRSVRAKLRDHSYRFPNSPNVDGTILEEPGLPRVGLWLMPDNQTPGMLEDFCIQMIKGTGHQQAEAAVSTAQAAGVCTFKPDHLSKAIVHTYLAWQDEPGRPLGQAITSRTLRPDTETAKAFVAWLTRLFGG
jgi:hypothetical protein